MVRIAHPTRLIRLRCCACPAPRPYFAAASTLRANSFMKRDCSVTNLMKFSGVEPTASSPSTSNCFNTSGTASGADLSFTTSLSLLQNWRQQAFGTTVNSGTSADSADYDGDGIPNLIEYALNLNPKATSKLPVSSAVKGANFEYTYSRSTAAVNAGMTYTVEWSAALPATWGSSGVTQTVLSDDGTTQQVKAVIPMNAASRMFVHLSVTSTP